MNRLGPAHAKSPRPVADRRQKAVIIDMDGTLVNVSSARHFVLRPKDEKDFDAFHAASRDCPPNQQALDYAERHFNAGYKLLIVSARKQRWHGVTVDWLTEHFPWPYDGPFMRQDDDDNSDVSVKKQIFTYLSRSYWIQGACDDRPEVVELWRKLGLQVEVVPGWDYDRQKEKNSG